MPLRVHNVLSDQKEDFVPLTEGQVRMYVCGPTVYDHAHLGHAKTYIAFDLIVRFLRYSGYQVRYVQNITDVGHLLESGEDRILRKAGQLGTEPMEIVETYTRSYFEDMDALGVTRPDISPRASGHVPEQIEMITRLIDKGHAYVVGGDVYYDVSSFGDYGKLSNRKLEEQESGMRVDVEESKRHPADFALWKNAQDEHLLKWRSPWGWGFPGWHIECSAMANRYLGPTFDIHGGGIDNIFPHNECEIAQSEAANGQPFARYWLLTGSLTVEGVKMSKSLGNFMTVKDALEKYPPQAIRAFVFSGHYSNPIDFSEDAIYAAQKGWERLMGAVTLTRERLRDASEGDGEKGFLDTVEAHKARAVEALNDDFNAPAAMGVLQNFTREVNHLLNSGDAAASDRTILQAIDDLYRDIGGDVLGIVSGATARTADAGREDGLIRLLLDLRQQYRAEKQFDKSDEIRDRLAELGVTIEDRPDGTVYRV